MKELDLKVLDAMPSMDIDVLRSQALAEQSETFNSLSLVKEDILKIQLDIIDLQRKKKILEITEEQGKQTLNTIRTQVKILEAKFWSSKNDSR